MRYIGFCERLFVFRVIGFLWLMLFRFYYSFVIVYFVLFLRESVLSLLFGGFVEIG